MKLRRSGFMILSAVAMLLVTSSSATGDGTSRSQRANGRGSIPVDGQWHRFTTQRGQDLNFKLTRDRAGKLKGRVIVGRTSTEGDRGRIKGGALSQLLRLEVRQRGLLGRAVKLRGGHAGPRPGRYPKFEVTFKGAQTSGAGGDVVRFDSLRLRSKRWWLGRWKTLVSGQRDTLSRAAVGVNRRPITGSAAAEIIRVLGQAGAPNIDIDGLNYRGLYIPPYFTQASLDNYKIRFDAIAVPVQLADALTGLRSLGLRSNHPIFNRLR